MGAGEVGTAFPAAFELLSQSHTSGRSVFTNRILPSHPKKLSLSSNRPLN
jgi:hypothetical protein